MKRLVIVLLAFVPACALVHERGRTTEPIDAGMFRADAVAVRDAIAPAPDAFVPASDAGPITSCFEFWNALPACPANIMLAMGQPCSVEGATCGVHCCEPGPPIGCHAGRWAPLNQMDDCSGIRCVTPFACGTGFCAHGRVCVLNDGELGGPSNGSCAMPPAPIDSCESAPVGSVGDDPMGCTACECQNQDGNVVVTLDCRCC